MELELSFFSVTVLSLQYYCLEVRTVDRSKDKVSSVRCLLCIILETILIVPKDAYNRCISKYLYLFLFFRMGISLSPLFIASMPLNGSLIGLPCQTWFSFLPNTSITNWCLTYINLSNSFQNPVLCVRKYLNHCVHVCVCKWGSKDFYIFRNFEKGFVWDCFSQSLGDVIVWTFELFYYFVGVHVPFYLLLLPGFISETIILLLIIVTQHFGCIIVNALWDFHGGAV